MEALIDTSFSSNEDIKEIALDLCTSPDIDCPVRGAFNFVKDNIGNAPNTYTSLIEAMGGLGKPYIGFTVAGQDRTWNEVYTSKRKIIVDLANGEFDSKNPIFQDESKIIARYNQFGAVTGEEFIISRSPLMTMVFTVFGAFVSAFFMSMFRGK